MYVYIKSLTLKAYKKIRRAADIISHSSSEERSSRWSKLSNVTACIGGHSLAVEFNNAIRFRLRSGPL